MFVTAVMTVVCTAGVAFNVRFLVALCRECTFHRTGDWVRLRLDSSEDAVVELPQWKQSVTRAA